MKDIMLTPNENDVLLQKCGNLLQDYLRVTGLPAPFPCEPHMIHNMLLDILKQNDINVYVDEKQATQSLYGTYYISSIDDPVSTHRSRFIIHRPDIFYLAEFANKQQLDQFADMLGFTYKQVTIRPYSNIKRNMYREYTIDKTICDNHLFWDKSELPEGARPFRAKSNGQLVTCYFVTNKHTIEIYRPNPNAPSVYDPAGTDDMLAFMREHGSY